MRREKHLCERVIDFGNLYRASTAAEPSQPTDATSGAAMGAWKATSRTLRRNANNWLDGDVRLAETRPSKAASFIVAAVLTLTGVGAIIGIPMLIFGLFGLGAADRQKKRAEAELRLVEESIAKKHGEMARLRYGEAKASQ